MTTMRAMALPVGSSVSRAATSRAVVGQGVPSTTAHVQAARGQALGGGTAGGEAVRGGTGGGEAVRGQAARRHSGPGVAASVQAASMPLRLTRRGHVVIAVAAALLLTVLLLVVSGPAQATSHSASPRTAQQSLTRVLVRPGQSLWSVAESADPGADTRQVIQQIIELNGLTGSALSAGQQLWVPRG
jgi:LysM domain